MITDKIIILDAFGTIVQITTRTNPYKSITLPGNVNPMIRNVHPDIIIQENNLSKYDAYLFGRKLLIELSAIKEVDGARNVLKKIKKHNNYLVVASNLATPYCDVLREIYGDIIDLFWLSCEIGDKKPSASFYLKLIDHINQSTILDTNLKNVYMIGDSYVNDFLAPTQLGINAIYEVGLDKLVDWYNIEQKVIDL